MKTKLNYDGQYLSMPTVFRPDFNNFANISSTQAWSLFFTASRDDMALGKNFAVGQLWTFLLGATVISSVISVLVFKSI